MKKQYQRFCSIVIILLLNICIGVNLPNGTYICSSNGDNCNNGTYTCNSGNCIVECRWNTCKGMVTFEGFGNSLTIKCIMDDCENWYENGNCGKINVYCSMESTCVIECGKSGCTPNGACGNNAELNPDFNFFCGPNNCACNDADDLRCPNGNNFTIDNTFYTVSPTLEPTTLPIRVDTVAPSKWINISTITPTNIEDITPTSHSELLPTISPIIIGFIICICVTIVIYTIYYLYYKHTHPNKSTVSSIKYNDVNDDPNSKDVIPKQDNPVLLKVLPAHVEPNISLSLPPQISITYEPINDNDIEMDYNNNNKTNNITHDNA